MKQLYKYGLFITILLRLLAGGRIYYVNSKFPEARDSYPSIGAAKAAGAGDRYFDWILISLIHEEPA